MLSETQDGVPDAAARAAWTFVGARMRVHDGTMHNKREALRAMNGARDALRVALIDARRAPYRTEERERLVPLYDMHNESQNVRYMTPRGDGS